MRAFLIPRAAKMPEEQTSVNAKVTRQVESLCGFASLRLCVMLSVVLRLPLRLALAIITVLPVFHVPIQAGIV